MGVGDGLDVRQVVVFGGGGHAKVVIATLRSAGYEVLVVGDDDRAKWGTRLMDVQIRAVTEAVDMGKDVFSVVAIGDNRARADMVHRLGRIRWLSVVHPLAFVDPTAHVGVGTVIFAGAVVQPNAQLGDHVIVNTSATVDHDCVLRDFVHVAPGVHLSGGVQIGTGAMLGVGAVVIPNRQIGAWSKIGAGGVVIDDIDGGITAVGVPARATR